MGEELEAVSGPIRIVCNSDLHPRDVRTAKAAQMAVRRAWTSSEPERWLEGEGGPRVQQRLLRLFHLLRDGKLQVRVLPDAAFGLIHGKAGVITRADGSRLCFLGSTNESQWAWQLNYELLWEDDDPVAVLWVQNEFDALWQHNAAVPLSDAVIQDIERLARRRVIHTLDDWQPDTELAAAVIETPVYRREFGLWAHQKQFVKQVIDAHQGPLGQARYVLADQVGLGKTLQLAMSAQLIALTGNKPILIICPKTLVWQWQGEMRDLLDMPSAVWDGQRWIDENDVKYAPLGPKGIRRCPRRVGIVSSGLINRRSEAALQLLNLEYDCVILDEAHRARRRNLGENRDHESPDRNNLLQFMCELAPRTRSLLLATATPVQLRPIEAWDLLDILSRGDESVLGNIHSKWRRTADVGLALVMEHVIPEMADDEKWEWMRNPFPPAHESRDFEILRRRLGVSDEVAVIDGAALSNLRANDRSRLWRTFPVLLRDHNPYIRRIVRRTRHQLEQSIDPETGEPLLKPIEVQLLGERAEDAIELPGYLRAAYELAEEFCELLNQRRRAGFMRTLLLRRVGSTLYAGRQTALAMLDEWQDVPGEEDDEDDMATEGVAYDGRTLTPDERDRLEHFVDALERHQGRDPKYAIVLDCLRQRGWLALGCIIFSQYRDSLQWLAEQLTVEYPEEPIALYSGPTTSGIMRGGVWQRAERESLKQMVRRGELRLLLGTDAASEGLNLQTMARLINLDLPWNPTRLEQRKGRIQRIGQVHETVQIYNMRYRGSVEDRVHQMLSSRLRDIFDLFGQLPDVLEDVWVNLALGKEEEARKVIDAVPEHHPFVQRYAHEVSPVDWERCAVVLDSIEKRRVLMEGW